MFKEMAWLHRIHKFLEKNWEAKRLFWSSAAAQEKINELCYMIDFLKKIHPEYVISPTPPTTPSPVAPIEEPINENLIDELLDSPGKKVQEDHIPIRY